MRPIHRTSAAFVLGYLALGSTLPFLLSYRESHANHSPLHKGTISTRSLFAKIWEGFYRVDVSRLILVWRQTADLWHEYFVGFYGLFCFWCFLLSSPWRWRLVLFRMLVFSFDFLVRAIALRSLSSIINWQPHCYHCCIVRPCRPRSHLLRVSHINNAGITSSISWNFHSRPCHQEVPTYSRCLSTVCSTATFTCRYSSCTYILLYVHHSTRSNSPLHTPRLVLGQPQSRLILGMRLGVVRRLLLYGKTNTISFRLCCLYAIRNVNTNSKRQIDVPPSGAARVV